MKIVKINVRGSGVIAPSGTRFKSLLHLNIYIQFSTEKKKKKKNWSHKSNGGNGIPILYSLVNCMMIKENEKK